MRALKNNGDDNDDGDNNNNDDDSELDQKGRYLFYSLLVNFAPFTSDYHKLAVFVLLWNVCVVSTTFHPRGIHKWTTSIVYDSN